MIVIFDHLMNVIVRQILIVASLIFYVQIGIKAQDPKPNYSLLWEVTGEDLKGKSFVFGSAHINSVEAFDFPLSLLKALESCDAFSTEVDMDSMNLLMIDMVLDELAGDAEDLSSTESMYDDPNGKETYMDLYLFRIAKVLGKKTYGLEYLNDQMEILAFLSDENEMEEISAEEFDEFLKVYARGDISEMAELVEEEISGDLQMKSRNKTQAESIIRLGKRQSTFSVVGAAHLFGEDNVLELLRRAGYSVKSVPYDVPGSLEIEKIYASELEESWQNVIGYSGGYTFRSPNKFRSILMEEVLDINVDAQLDLGLVYMTMAARLVGNEGRFLQQSILDSYIEDAEKILRLDSVDTEFGKDYDLFYEGGLVLRCKASQLEDRVTIQIVMGLSKSSLNHDNVEKYLDGLSLIESGGTWTVQHSNEGFFKYYFEEDVPWQINSLHQPGFEDRDKVDINYKVAYDKDKNNSYIVRYQHHIPGVAYLNEISDLGNIGSHFSAMFGAELVETEISTLEGYNAADFLLQKEGGFFFIKTIIRGAYLYALIQASNNGIRNEKFFDSFEFVDFENSELSPLNSSEDDFSILYPSFQFSYESDDDGDEVMNLSLIHISEPTRPY